MGRPGHRGAESHVLIGEGVFESQVLGMQQQARAERFDLWRCVQGVPQDRVADALQVHPELVGAPGHGLQFYQSRTGAALQFPPAAAAGFAIRVDDVQRPPFPIKQDRAVDRVPACFVWGTGQGAVLGTSGGNGQVAFLNLPGFKQAAQAPLRLDAQAMINRPEVSWSSRCTTKACG